jgi:hypothetical protein
MKDLLIAEIKEFFDSADGITIIKRILGVILICIGFIAICSADAIGVGNVFMVLIFCVFVGICADVKSAFK